MNDNMTDELLIRKEAAEAQLNKNSKHCLCYDTPVEILTTRLHNMNLKYCR
jgi:hypothetical protein